MFRFFPFLSVGIRVLPTNLRYCSKSRSSIEKFIHLMIFNVNFSDTSYSKTLIIPIGQKFRGYIKLEHNSFGGLVLYLEKERCLIFIDHAIAYQNIKPIGGRIDYVKFKEIISESCHLVGAIIFLGLLEKVSNEQKSFFPF